ncbi:MAG: amidohydrolase [Promethearchaeota archaeon]
MSEGRIFYGGSIITMNDDDPSVEAVGIKEDKIVAVGGFTKVKQKLPTAELINLNGNTLLPGFHDCHCHPIPYVFFQVILNLGDIKSYEEFQNVLKNYTKNKKPNDWILGLAYNETNFEDEIKLPNRWELDNICPNNPTFILRHDGHIGFANSLALKLTGIDEKSIPPEGSQYRKNKNGQLNGEITEKATRKIILKAFNPLLQNLDKIGFSAFQKIASKGITTLHSIINYDTSGDPDDIRANEIPLLKSMQDNILQNWYSFVHIKKPRKLKRLRKPPLHGGKRDSKFKVNAIKLYIDGSLGASTAWMNEPFLDNPENSGLCVYDNLEDLYNIMKDAHNLGYQIGIHSIGDKANRVLVDLYKRLLNEYPKEDHRHRIEHASLLTSDVIKDMKELGLIASIQPPFITTDKKLALYRLGEERAKYTYPIKSLIEAGVVCASGSDSPVEDPDVIWGLHALVNRDDFIPEECISIKEALKTYTINGAYAAFEEDIKGSIDVGKLADFVILDKNPLETAKNEIKNLQVLETIIRGKTVFKKE